MYRKEGHPAAFPTRPGRNCVKRRKDSVAKGKMNVILFFLVHGSMSGACEEKRDCFNGCQKQNQVKSIQTQPIPRIITLLVIFGRSAFESFERVAVRVQTNKRERQ